MDQSSSTWQKYAIASLTVSLVSILGPGSYVAARPTSLQSASVGSLPLNVRQEVDRLASGDAGARATAAEALIELGAAATSAIPWLVAALDDDRDVFSLKYGRTTVQHVAGKALIGLGQPAVMYVTASLANPQINGVQRRAAVIALAVLRPPAGLTFLMKQMDDLATADSRSRSDSVLLRTVRTSALCFLPDKSAVDVVLRVAELQEPSAQYDSLNILETPTGHQFASSAEPSKILQAVIEARKWWTVNAASATLKRIDISWCQD